MNLPFSHIDSPATFGKKKARKLLTPYLHQLPFISKKIDTPAPFTPRDIETEEIENSEESCEVLRSKRSTDATPKLAFVKKPSTQMVLEELNPSKSTKLRVAKLLQRKETNIPCSKAVNGNLVDLLPKMKAKNLRDRIILLKQAARQLDNEEEQKVNKNENQVKNVKKGKSKSIIPEVFLEKKSPSSQDFAGVLESFLFKKKEKLCLIDKPQEPQTALAKVSILSPQASMKSLKSPKEQNSGGSIQRTLSQANNTLAKESIFLPPPSASKFTKSKTQLKSNISNLKSEKELSQELEFFLENDKPSRYQHKRVASLGQSIFTGERPFEKEKIGKVKLRNSIKTQGSCEKIDVHLEGISPIIESISDLALFGPSVQTFGKDKMSSSVINNLTSPKGTIPGAMHSSQYLPKLEKSYTNFNLKLHGATQKEEINTKNTLSTDSRKTNGQPTTCSTKRRLSIERINKKYNGDDDFDLYDLVSSIKDPSSRYLDSKRECELIISGHREPRNI